MQTFANNNMSNPKADHEPDAYKLATVLNFDDKHSVVIVAANYTSLTAAWNRLTGLDLDVGMVQEITIKRKGKKK